MESISEITRTALQGDVLERLSAQIRENPSAIKRGLEHAVPASMAGLNSYAASDGKTEELLGAFRGGDYPHVDARGVQDMVGDPAATARMAQSSSGFVGRIFGDKQIAVVDAIAKQSGLTRSGASTVLGLATPLVLGAVGRETEEKHLDARGLSRLLADQGKSVAGSLPGPLATAIGGLGIAGVAGVASTTTTTTTNVSAAPRGTGNPLHNIKERAESAFEHVRGSSHARGSSEGTTERIRGSSEGGTERVRGTEYGRDREIEHVRATGGHRRSATSDALHRSHLAGRETVREERHHEPHARRGMLWRLLAVAALAIAALFMFTRRNSVPDLPKISTPDLPKAAESAKNRTEDAVKPTQPAQPAQPAQPEPTQQQAAAPEQQPAAPEQQPAAPEQQPAAPEQQPAGVTAETLSASSGAAALTAFLDGSETLPKRFVLQDIEFATGSSAVPSSSMLDEVAAALKAHPNAEVRLDGYADASGDPAENAELSAARAENVQQYLIDNGAGAGQVTSTGEATDRPVASNDTSQGRAQNRRVELVVTAR